MDKKREPDPRWLQFIEQLDSEGVAVGFTLPNNDFVYKYDKDGGWEDENGNYYNADGILQSDEEEPNDQEEDSEEFSEHDEELVDEFEELLREAEEGIVKKPKKAETKEQVPSPVKEEDTKGDEINFKAQISKYITKERLREELPQHLFIYFKQKGKEYELIKPEVQNQQSVQKKNQAIKSIKAKIEQKRQKLKEKNVWLSSPGVFLDFSGDSQVENTYDRYWYGHIKTTSDQYLSLINQIKDSKQFNLLEIKTFYALKAKQYLKKSEEKVKQYIQSIKEKVIAINDSQVVVFKIDNLPQNFPLSFVYDLIDYVGGETEDIEQIKALDEFSVQLSALKRTALKIVNLEGYNHDKGQFLELEVKDVSPRVTVPEKHRLYYIGVDSVFKIHERQLFDTLALANSKEELAKSFSKEDSVQNSSRFAVGSACALRRILMFRGDSLNAIHVSPVPAKK